MSCGQKQISIPGADICHSDHGVITFYALIPISHLAEFVRQDCFFIKLRI